MLVAHATLLLLALALAWAAFFRAGVWAADWDVSLLVVGCLAIAYWRLTPRVRRAPVIPGWLRWSMMLLPAYIVLQMVPLPLRLVKALSPSRFVLAKQLEPIGFHLNAAPLSVNPPQTILLLFTILACALTFLLARELTWRFATSPWMTAIPLIALAVIEAIIGLVQVFGLSADHGTGTYTNRNHFAGYLEMLLPFATLYGFVSVREKQHRSGFTAAAALRACALWGVAALLLIATIYSLSRMGFIVSLWALFAIAVLAIVPRLPSRAWRWSTLGVLGIMIVATFIVLPPAQLIERFIELSSTEKLSGNVRLGLWRETLPLISEFHLTGCGLGGYESVFLKYQQVAAGFSIEFAHNDYLQYLAELGPLGFAMLATIIGGIFLQILRGVFRLTDLRRRLLAVSCAGAFIAILLHSIVDFNMYIPANAMTLAWIAGIGSITVHSSRIRVRQPSASETFASV